MSRHGKPEPVALACSGLGHVRRGNETWALDVARALHGAGVPVVLFGGGPCPDVGAPYVRLANLRRDFPLMRRWLSWSRRYLAEQLTFLVSLRRRLVRDGIRRVHLCDPDLAWQMHKRTRGEGVRVAFKDGMRLGPQWCGRLDFVQVLAPYYRDVVAREAGVDTTGWHVIPHLVDVERIRPATERASARRAWPELGLPADAWVILGVGDYSAGGNKRLDWLVREVASMPATSKGHLILAGQAEPEIFGAFEAAARSALGGRVTLLRNLPREQVLRLYPMADAFVHAALREPFGIVFLEAMASGLPVVGHAWEVTRWIVGDAGAIVDMEAPGALAALLQRWVTVPGERMQLAEAARRRAEEMFAPSRLVPRYAELYAAMDAGTPPAKGRSRV